MGDQMIGKIEREFQTRKVDVFLVASAKRVLGRRERKKVVKTTCEVQTAMGEARVGAGAAPGEPHSREVRIRKGGRGAGQLYMHLEETGESRRAPGSSAPRIEAPCPRPLF